MPPYASQDIVGVQVRHHLRGRRDGRDCGRICEMKVARMQFRRMHTDQRDCVKALTCASLELCKRGAAKQTNRGERK
jgi:hypothetical protein